MGRQPFPVDLALDDYLVAGVGQLVQGAIAQDGVVEEALPHTSLPFFPPNVDVQLLQSLYDSAVQDFLRNARVAGNFNCDC